MDEVVVGAGLGDAFDVIELLGDGEGALEAEIVAWLEIALACAHDEGADDAGGRQEAGHVCLDAEAPERDAEIERGLRGPGPLPVAEQVENAHGREDYNS